MSTTKATLNHYKKFVRTHGMPIPNPETKVKYEQLMLLNGITDDMILSDPGVRKELSAEEKDLLKLKDEQKNEKAKQEHPNYELVQKLIKLKRIEKSKEGFEEIYMGMKYEELEFMVAEIEESAENVEATQKAADELKAQQEKPLAELEKEASDDVKKFIEEILKLEEELKVVRDDEGIKKLYLADSLELEGLINDLNQDLVDLKKEDKKGPKNKTEKKVDEKTEEKHIVTEADMTPQLVKEGVKIGDEIDLGRVSKTKQETTEKGKTADLPPAGQDNELGKDEQTEKTFKETLLERLQILPKDKDGYFPPNGEDERAFKALKKKAREVHGVANAAYFRTEGDLIEELLKSL